MLKGFCSGIRGKTVLSIAFVSFLFCGCGDQGGATESASVTTEATEVSTTASTAAQGAMTEHSIEDMTYSIRDVWAGDGTASGGSVRYDLDDSMLIITVMDDAGDITNPDVRAQYREGISANYETELSLMDCDTIAERPAFGVTGDIRLSDEGYRLFSYIIRSNSKWYYIQYFQREGEDHQTEFDEFLGSIRFNEEVVTDVLHRTGYVEYTVPSNWRGDGSLNEAGATYYYPDHGMLMVEEIPNNADLSSADVQTALLNDFNDGLDSGEIGMTNTLLVDNCFVMRAAGECTVSGLKMKISALYIQVEDKIYGFSMGSFEGHYTDYDTETETVFSSIRVVPKDPVTTESTENNGNSTETKLPGVRPEFKSTMDGYEQFFDEYYAYMKKYQETNDPSTMSDYSDFVKKYDDVLKQLRELDLSSLSPEETAYYNEVMERINRKLTDAAATP